MTSRKLLLLIFIFLSYFPAFAEEKALSYSVTTQGLPLEDLEGAVRANSTLFSQIDRPPPTIFGLRRRVETDLPNIKGALDAFGFYEAVIQAEVVPPSGGSAEVILHIDAGPRYTFEGLVFEPESLDLCMADLHLRSGRPVDARRFEDAEDFAVQSLQNRGYPFVKISGRHILANRECQTATLYLEIDPGPYLYFGSVEIVGPHKVHPCVVEREIKWTAGDPYCAEAVFKTQQELESLNLFSATIITKGEPEGDTVPITISVVEAPVRSLGFGLGYATDEGPGALATWEHRNLFASGETLSFEVEGTAITKTGGVNLTYPYFLCPQQDLTTGFQVDHKKREGYTEMSYTASSIARYHFSPRFWASYGLEFKKLITTDSSQNTPFALLGVPLGFSIANTEPLTLPRHGGVFRVRAVPYLDIDKEKDFFTKLQFTAAYYLTPFHDKGPLTFMLYGTAGSIFGTEIAGIPPSIRFYSGSSTFLPGYRFETVSPLRADNKPDGGRSILIAGIQPRLKVYGEWYLQGVYNIGNVYSEPWPKLRDPYLQSAGGGILYNTPVGPISVQIAFPLDKRPGVDRNWELYFNFGASF